MYCVQYDAGRLDMGPCRKSIHCGTPQPRVLRSVRGVGSDASGPAAECSVSSEAAAQTGVMTPGIDSPRRVRGVTYNRIGFRHPIWSDDDPALVTPDFLIAR